jgi:hypothetical protein
VVNKQGLPISKRGAKEKEFDELVVGQEAQALPLYLVYVLSSPSPLSPLPSSSSLFTLPSSLSPLTSSSSLFLFPLPSSLFPLPSSLFPLPSPLSPPLSLSPFCSTHSPSKLRRDHLAEVWNNEPEAYFGDASFDPKYIRAYVRKMSLAPPNENLSHVSLEDGEDVPLNPIWK